MSRKPKIPTDGAPPLSSNPFAALAGALGDLPPAPAAEQPEAPRAPADAGSLRLRGKIVVRREKKRRGGKTATVLEGLQLSDDALEILAQELRRSLGCGAYVEGATVVVSGAQIDRIRDFLSARGAKRIVIGN
jgi:translation initiation factor 1